jgi:hypothetical protein
MKKLLAPIFCVFSGCLLLAGCTDADWDHVMNYGGLRDTDAVSDAPPPQDSRPATVAEVPAAITAAPAEPANANLCRAVAAQDAGGNDFDKATQARVYAQSYAQCLNIYAR